MAVAVRTITCAAGGGGGGGGAAAATAAAAWRVDVEGGRRAGKGGTYGSACSLQKRPPNEVRGVLLRSLLRGVLLWLMCRVW